MLSLSPRWHLENPRTSLTISFITWKVLLLLIACTSPYPGYDTSTTLLTEPHDGQYATSTVLRILANKLTRWDAIYFANVGHRGAVFEQEWAFGWGYAKIIGILGRGLFGSDAGVLETAVAGILISNIAHLLSVLVLYSNSKLINETPSSPRSQLFAFISASLHTISPAGLFLSAPYAESSFSLLNFVGFSLYASSLQAHRGGYSNRRDVLVIISGLAFGLATTCRSNGLLSGLLFCFDVIRSMSTILEDMQQKAQSGLRRIIFLVTAGLLVAAGSVFPQYRVPSIYAWVQSYYWYHCSSLFWLAMPMLLILGASAFSFLLSSKIPSSATEGKSPGSECREHDWLSPVGMEVARRFAVPQLVLALLAIMSYHVQIVTRISSGYPLWYWWLASKIIAGYDIKLAGCSIGVKVIVMWMVIYAYVQAGLFAAFLPPA